MKLLKHIPAWLKNKYLIASALFFAILLFFDDNNLILQFQRWQRLNELGKTENHLSKQISQTRTELNLLKTSAETIEKYAREKYLMKKDNEDVFVFQPDKK